MNLSEDTKHDILMRSIKIIDIGYLAVIYFILAIIYCLATDKILGNFDAKVEDVKSIPRIVGESILHIWIIGVSIYIIRNVVELVPFPLNGYHGFVHGRVKELSNAVVFSTVVMTYQFYFRDRLDYLFTRIKTEYLS